MTDGGLTACKHDTSLGWRFVQYFNDFFISVAHGGLVKLMALALLDKLTPELLVRIDALTQTLAD